MKTAHVIWITGLECAPGKEKEFQLWYNKTHMPLVLTIPGVIRGTRYERIENDEQYPRFFNIYEMDNVESIKESYKSKMMEAATEDVRVNGPRVGLNVRWRTYYRRIGNQSEDAYLELRSAKVIWPVGMECTPGKEDDFNKWYDETHVPLFLQVPGVVAAARYQRAINRKEFPAFLNIYGLEDEASIGKLARGEGMEVSLKDARENITGLGLKVQWQAHYRQIDPSEGSG